MLYVGIALGGVAVSAVIGALVVSQRRRATRASSEANEFLRRGTAQERSFEIANCQLQANVEAFKARASMHARTSYGVEMGTIGTGGPGGLVEMPLEAASSTSGQGEAVDITLQCSDDLDAGAIHFG